MSAYVVSKAEIAALVTAAVRWSNETAGGENYYWFGGARPISDATAPTIGQMLWHANWYHAEGWAQGQVDDVEAEPTYVHEALPDEPSPLLIIAIRLGSHRRTALITFSRQLLGSWLRKRSSGAQR